LEGTADTAVAHRFLRCGGAKMNITVM